MFESRSSIPGLGVSLPPMLVVAMAVALLSGGGSGERAPSLATSAGAAARQPAGDAQPPEASTAASVAVASSGATRPLDVAMLDAWLAETETARTIDTYLADAGCQRGAAALLTTGGRAAAAPWQARGEQVPCDLSAVIVTLADYEDSNSRWQADRTLATIQSAIGAAGYTLERFSLPGAGGTGGAAPRQAAEARRDPGVLLFGRAVSDTRAALREEAAGHGRLEILAIFTVPEMPTSGIERLPLLAAAHLALGLHALPHSEGPAHAQSLRVVGPSYSGSSLSLLRGLEEMALLEGTQVERQGLQVDVISGSATSAGNWTVLDGPLAHDGQIDFTRTVHEDDTLLRALRSQLAAIQPEWACGRGVAILVESTTGWGASLAQVTGNGTGAAARPEGGTCDADPKGGGELFPEALRLGFPLHIADRYAARQRAGGGLPSYAQLLAPTEVLRLDDSITPSDRLPTFTPFITNAARDLTLTGILAQLQRHRIGAVGILGTDIRDHLFLAREINRVVPDVVMFGTEPDILMLHPEYQPYVRGTLMATSYPLQGHVQTLTHARDTHNRRIQFTSMAQQGLYNALLRAVGQPHEVDALMVDYRAPEGSRRADLPPQCEEDGGRELQRPVPWVVVAGQREFLPLSVHPELISTQDCAVMPARVNRDAGDDQDRYLFASGQERVMWMLPSAVAIFALGLWAVGRWRPLPSARWLSPPVAVECRMRDARFAPRQTSEWAALRAEHALFSLAAAVAVSLFAAWQTHVWHDVSPRGTVAHELTEWLSLLCSGLSIIGVAVMLVVALRRLAAVAQSRGSRRSRARTLALRSLAGSAPEVIALAVVTLGAWFVGAMVWYLWHDHTGSPANQLFAAARSFDVINLLSAAPMLALFPGIVMVWTMWSLRTLYYQRISPTCAAPLVHALVSHDARDRRLEQAMRGTLGTTMQPAGAFLALPLLLLVVIVVLLEPRVASFEGHAFGRVLLLGSTLATMAVSLELGQAAWLANRVVRLLQRVRIHAIGPLVEAMEHEPLDWRPTLAPSQSPYRLLLRGLHVVGHQPRPEAPALASQDKVPLLRTQAWHEALWLAGRRLARSRASGLPLTADEGRLAALVISLLLQSLVTRVVRGFGIAVLLGLWLLVGHLLTPFSGRSLALMIDVGLLIVTAAVAIRALLMLERDHVLSKLWRGTPGSLNMNSGLVWRAVAYAGLPLLTIISVRFPEIGGRLLTVVEPLRHMLPTP